MGIKFSGKKMQHLKCVTKNGNNTLSSSTADSSTSNLKNYIIHYSDFQVLL